MDTKRRSRPPLAGRRSPAPASRFRKPADGAARTPVTRADAARRPVEGKRPAAAKTRLTKPPKSVRSAPKVAASGPEDGTRLQKILSASGVASRRASEQLILEGRVSVNGVTIRELGSKADSATDDIRVDGRRIRTDLRHRYILMFKPRGYVTTRQDPEGRPTVMDLLGRDVGYVYPVGRLDYDSEGLLLLTSDGALAEKLTHPRHEVPKLYEVIVLGTPEHEAIEKLRRGVSLDGKRTAPAEVRVFTTVKATRPTTRLTIVLREGRNRQVRNMCQAVGLPVRDLRRIQIGEIGIGRLRPGEWRELLPREVASLRDSADGGGAPSARPRGPRARRPR